MVSVALNGADIDGIVLAEDISIRVGRTSVLDHGEPGSAALVLWLEQWQPVQAGDTITITDGGSVRFEGKIADAPGTWWEDDDHAAHGRMIGVRILAVGPLASWGREVIGDQPWPSETIADRALRVAAITGDTIVVQGGHGVMVTARDVDAQPAINVLEDCAEDGSGWLFDHAGTTYLQSLEIRRVGDPQERWDDLADPWDQLDQAWDDMSAPSSQLPAALVLPPGAVLWAPPWQQSSALANVARVRWGVPDAEGQQSEAVRTDQASIDQHSRHEATVVTRLAEQGDAELRAALIIERGAQPQWHLPTVEVAWELSDPSTQQALQGMLPGTRCELTALPMPGPSPVFTGIVEGWDERWEWDGDADQLLRTFTLHLSDVRWSFAVLTWDGIVPDTLAWDAIDATWDDMLTADDLED